MEDEGQLERVELLASVCLPLRSCRLYMTTHTTDYWLADKITFSFQHFSLYIDIAVVLFC